MSFLSVSPFQFFIFDCLILAKMQTPEPPRRLKIPVETGWVGWWGVIIRALGVSWIHNSKLPIFSLEFVNSHVKNFEFLIEEFKTAG